MRILSVKAVDAQSFLLDLIHLLQDAVASGASVGYLNPLSDEEACQYWQDVLEGLRKGNRILLVAMEGDVLAGTVQLVLESRPNGRHRAEVSKLLVHTRYRRRGIGRALMEAVEARAREAGRTTLYLDTRAGDLSVQLYQSIGYSEVGIIPEYVRETDGSYSATLYMYKLLRQPAA